MQFLLSSFYKALYTKQLILDNIIFSLYVGCHIFYIMKYKFLSVRDTHIFIIILNKFIQPLWYTFEEFFPLKVIEYPTFLTRSFINLAYWIPQTLELDVWEFCLYAKNPSLHLALSFMIQFLDYCTNWIVQNKHTKLYGTQSSMTFTRNPQYTDSAINMFIFVNILTFHTVTPFKCLLC